jgi:hypothetical protein
VNWVENEVRLGLSRAAAAPDYPFIPILAKECSGSAALPCFARQYQGVHDPLNDAEEFVKLLRAVLRRSPSPLSPTAAALISTLATSEPGRQTCCAPTSLRKGRTP